MWTDWVIDASYCDEFLCFVPIENEGTDEERLIVGMNVLSDVEHFDLGRIVGIVHLDGQEACDRWVKKHPDILEAIKLKHRVKEV